MIKSLQMPLRVPYTGTCSTCVHIHTCIRVVHTHTYTGTYQEINIVVWCKKKQARRMHNVEEQLKRDIDNGDHRHKQEFARFRKKKEEQKIAG